MDVISAMRQKLPRYAKHLDPSDPDLVRTYMALSSINVKRGRVRRVDAMRLLKWRRVVQKNTDVVVSYVCLPKLARTRVINPAGAALKRENEGAIQLSI